MFCSFIVKFRLYLNDVYDVIVGSVVSVDGNLDRIVVWRRGGWSWWNFLSDMEEDLIGFR